MREEICAEVIYAIEPLQIRIYANERTSQNYVEFTYVNERTSQNYVEFMYANKKQA